MTSAMSVDWNELTNKRFFFHVDVIHFSLLLVVHQTYFVEKNSRYSNESNDIEIHILSNLSRTSFLRMIQPMRSKHLTISFAISIKALIEKQVFLLFLKR